MNAGTTKWATIHSFKGWEIPTLVLLIEEELAEDRFTTDEMIYTALTRCRHHLIVLNRGSQRYHDFFEQHVGKTR